MRRVIRRAWQSLAGPHRTTPLPVPSAEALASFDSWFEIIEQLQQQISELDVRWN
jgi:hypothetical protein